MAEKEPTIIARFYHACITKPGEGSKFGRNLTVGVVAKSLQEVVKIMENQYPEAEIWYIQHRGPIHHGTVDMNQFHFEDEPKQVKW